LAARNLPTRIYSAAAGGAAGAIRVAVTRGVAGRGADGSDLIALAQALDARLLPSAPGSK
jgi:hypothetical protein